MGGKSATGVFEWVSWLPTVNQTMCHMPRAPVWLQPCRALSSQCVYAVGKIPCIRPLHETRFRRRRCPSSTWLPGQLCSSFSNPGIRCGLPPALENGFYSAEDFHAGSTVTYQCNNGYYLLGDSRMFCTDNGSWNGISPSCLGEINAGNCCVDSVMSFGKHLPQVLRLSWHPIVNSTPSQ